ncbi:AbrB/MazE/SpoVT family DNA-binding domain-containing protein [Skermania sp. ID1734]|uniref:AbrB/MazE/SpoVT family DNA-binding domain-containing protein n=1 Tax=Skermania sp. ID1734 TaxID=2597516 RepID=UPI00117BFFC4|nr:AbrB/MazE/SpoVT family DNA-binding domain-containing protein [Skermania sp. ID1734]TSE00027.1 AbrB/MazE/SpoVT family DNA-binding domain-containing protein [Skermania sp. ID1734]
MLLNSKGQVTIPAALREKYGLREGDEVDVIDDENGLRIVRAAKPRSPGARLIKKMRGKASTAMSTDELLTLLRADD